MPDYPKIGLKTFTSINFVPEKQNHSVLMKVFERIFLS